MKLTGRYTKAGEQLALRAIAEGKALTVTRAAAGSGQTEIGAAVLQAESQALALHPMEQQEAKCVLPAVLTAGDAARAYVLREIGVYARLGAEAEVLYKLFTLDEGLTVEPGCDLTATFYLTETLLRPEQVCISVQPQGLMTQEGCAAEAARAADAVRGELNRHKTDQAAHRALFDGKADKTHTHPASQVTAGVLGSGVSAPGGADYGTFRLRNAAFGVSDPSGGQNGDLWIKYTV